MECLEAKAYTLMSTPPVSVSREEPLWSVARVMYETGVGSVLVVEGGRLVGILTRRDIVYLVATGRAAANPPVGSVMSLSPITAKQDEDVLSLLEKMREAKVRHLPIVDDEGRPVGVVSMQDILEHLAECFLRGLRGSP